MTARENSRLGARLLIAEPAIDGANARRAGIPPALKRMATRRPRSLELLGFVLGSHQEQHGSVLWTAHEGRRFTLYASSLRPSRNKMHLIDRINRDTHSRRRSSALV